MLLFGTVSAALASPPNETVRLFEVDDGGGFVERMQLSSDGALLVGRTRTSKVGFLLNTDTWETDEAAERSPLGFFVGPDSGCPVSAVTTSPASDPTDGGWSVWVACEDGRLLRYRYGGTGTPTLDAASGEVQVDDRLDGVWYEPRSNLVYALAASEGGTPGALHAIDPATLAVDAPGSGHPKTLATSGFAEGVVLTQNVAAPTLVVSHGNQNMSHIALSTGAASFILSGFGGGFGCADMCPAPSGDVFCVDPQGSIARYQLASRQFLSLGLRLDAPRGVGASLDPDDRWIAVTGDQVYVWEMADPITILVDDGPYYEGPSDGDNPIQDIVTADGYLFGGGEAGYLHVVTQNPWIYTQSVELTKIDGEIRSQPEVFRAGDTVELSFAVNKGGTFELRVGGERWTDGGALVTAGEVGTITPAQGEPYLGAVDTFVVDDRFAEGTNPVWVTVESALGDVGHAAALLVVDNPPAAPGVSLGFGDGALNVVVAGIPDVDLSHYLVWISDQPFTAADHPTGGPTGFRQPIRLEGKPGTDPAARFAGLENGRTYYVAARSYDQAGAESEMSAVKSGSPRAVYSAAEEVGERGGAPCATGSANPSSVLALLGAGLLAVRRRRRRGLALAAALLLAPVAHAQDRGDDGERDRWWKQDTTPARGNFEVRYGVIDLADPVLDEHYQQNAHNLLMIEVGPQIYRVLELDVGTGFFQELDFLRDAAGNPSDQRTMLTWWPFQVDGTLRAHFVDEQPVVPFVRYGWDYVIWSEKFDERVGGPKSTIRGGKFGTHWSLGANLLLDVLQPSRASFLETRTGINDSWLTVEWRRQHVDGRDFPWSGRDDRLNRDQRPLDFSGDAFTLGVKLDW
jgi:MYXO-CTERM domain-containing protein